MESGFFKPPKETKIVLKNQVVLAAVGKILQHLTMGRETFFWFELLEGSKIQGLEKSGFVNIGQG